MRASVTEPDLTILDLSLTMLRLSDETIAAWLRWAEDRRGEYGSLALACAVAMERAFITRQPPPRSETDGVG